MSVEVFFLLLLLLLLRMHFFMNYKMFGIAYGLSVWDGVSFMGDDVAVPDRP